MEKTKIARFLMGACLAVFFTVPYFVAMVGADEPVLIEIEDPKPIGGDWRVMRGYSAGAINEEQKLYVLYFLFDNGVLAFFRNEEARISVLNVDTSSFPDPKRVEKDLVFEDTDGDGYNDLKIPISENEFRVWRWNPEGQCFGEASVLRTAK